jgi:gas vesicle protein
MRKPL